MLPIVSGKQIISGQRFRQCLPMVEDPAHWCPEQALQRPIDASDDTELMPLQRYWILRTEGDAPAPKTLTVQVRM